MFISDSICIELNFSTANGKPYGILKKYNWVSKSIKLYTGSGNLYQEGIYDAATKSASAMNTKEMFDARKTMNSETTTLNEVIIYDTPTVPAPPPGYYLGPSIPGPGYYPPFPTYPVSPPNGGYNPDPGAIDCDGVPGGSAYWTECGCIGGYTGIDICVFEVKDDTLKKYYPCMVELVLNKLVQNDAYRELIQPFQSILLPNGALISINGSPNLIFDFSNQTYGGSSNEYKLGQTLQGYLTARSSKIEFNSSAMTNSSQLFLQAAAIHEVAHAYSTFYIKTGSYGYPVDTTKYSTWAMNIVSFEAAASSQFSNGNYTDHSLFLQNYVDNFVTILKQMNGSSYTDKQYQMAAIYGLNNAGDPPANSIVNGINLYSIYKGILVKSYDNLLSKFGITPAERDAFYLDNLVNVPANKKLPNNCP